MFKKLKKIKEVICSIKNILFEDAINSCLTILIIIISLAILAFKITADCDISQIRGYCTSGLISNIYLALCLVNANVIFLLTLRSTIEYHRPKD